jgi:hypothetical protein
VLVPRGSDDSRPTALDAPSESAKRAAPPTIATPGAVAAPNLEESPAAASGSLDATVPTSLAVPSLGDLGDVSTESRLARAASVRLARPYDSTTTTIEGCTVAAGRSLGTPVAAGTGTLDGRPAVVVVAEQPTGTTAVIAVRGRSCGRAVSAVLP